MKDKRGNPKQSTEVDDAPQWHSCIHIPTWWRTLLLKNEHLVSCFAQICWNYTWASNELKKYNTYFIIFEKDEWSPEMWLRERKWRDNHWWHRHSSSVAVTYHTRVCDDSSAQSKGRNAKQQSYVSVYTTETTTRIWRLVTEKQTWCEREQ